MKLVELDTEVEVPKGTRYLVRRRRAFPVRAAGKTRYYLQKLPLVLPQWLNWLGRRLAGR
jgi:hypothetical protein